MRPHCCLDKAGEGLNESFPLFSVSKPRVPVSPIFTVRFQQKHVRLSAEFYLWLTMRNSTSVVAHQQEEAGVDLDSESGRR